MYLRIKGGRKKAFIKEMKTSILLSFLDNMKC